MGEWVPVTERGQAIRRGVSEALWEERTLEAHRHANVLSAVEAHMEAGGASRRSAVSVVAPGLHWSTYRGWYKLYKGGEGPAWERLLDARIPPVPDRVAKDVCAAACMLRRADRSINTETAQAHLSAQFGDGGAVSAAALRRIWKAAGLEHIRSDAPEGGVGEEVEEYHGGGGLALLVAADEELNASLGLARAVQKAGNAQAEEQWLVLEREEIESHRSEDGCFTSEYNKAWRAGHEPGNADDRWAGDEGKRAYVDLSKLATLGMRPETLARKLLAMGVMPMLTERRGFAGLDGPAGAWQGVLGGIAYMPATLNKALAELGMLGANDALWSTHAQRWSDVSQAWTKSKPAWVQAAIYIDGTADPYWTRRYAKSGPVSRIGRVMPSLTRVAITSGAGVPLLVETFAGAASLKSQLIPMLERLEAALGPDAEVGRLTVVDSEVGTAGLMWALQARTDRFFITVIKGAVLQGATLRDHGEWSPYRERDEVRELWVDISGTGAPSHGISVRGVEMRRPESRRTSSTIFVTNVHTEDVSTTDIADAYLARWPCQEQLFRDARNGGGFNRSHGYGGDLVSHVSLETKKEKAARSVAARETRKARAEATHKLLDDGTHAVSKPVRKDALRLAEKATRSAERSLAAGHEKQAKLEGHPTQIFERDTGRDSTMTCLKLFALMLIEYTLKEYFGALGMEWRTFIEHFVHLPVTVRTTRQRRLFQIHANPRQPKRMAQLEAALIEVNSRRVHRDGRLLVFELLGAPGAGSSP